LKIKDRVTPLAIPITTITKIEQVKAHPDNSFISLNGGKGVGSLGHAGVLSFSFQC
jgi:hypothetical protein